MAPGRSVKSMVDDLVGDLIRVLGCALMAVTATGVALHPTHISVQLALNGRELDLEAPLPLHGQGRSDLDDHPDRIGTVNRGGGGGSPEGHPEDDRR